jgi:hypothetical protein
VSPILVRPVREQLEHDRIIRLLPTLARYKRRFEVGINPGAEQNAGVGTTAPIFPDAVLFSPEKARRVLGVVEIETVESVNHLEAMSQWALFGRLKVPFHLYVPVAALDVARRLSSDYQVVVSEIWSYDHLGDQVRFTLVHKVPEVGKPASLPAYTVKAPKPAPTPPPAPPAAKPAVKAKPASKAPSSHGKRAAKAVKPAAAARPRASAPPRKAAPVRKPARPAGKSSAKRPATTRGRAAAPSRKGPTATRRK